MKDYTLNDLVNDYSNYIRTIISNYTSGLSNEDQEEILEDTIFNVYKKLNVIDEEILKPYIAKTCKNLIINRLKDNKKFDADSLNAMNNDTNFEIIDDTSNIEDIMVSNDKIRMIKDIINNFNEEDKNVFIEYYFKNKKINDISKLYNLSKANIKVKLHRTRNTIKNELIKGGYNYD